MRHVSDSRQPSPMTLGFTSLVPLVPGTEGRDCIGVVR